MAGHDYSYVGASAEDIALESKNPHSDVSATKVHSAEPAAPAPRSRYLSRTLVLLFVPAFITAYYYWIWLYLLNRELDDAYKYGSRNEVWVFWSWFIVGVFALDWAAHGLVGVEVAMLETPFFQAPHLIGLFEHSEKTWGGVGGWFRCLTKCIRERNLKGITGMYKSLKTYKLWYLLAFVTLSLYVGLPLSGLTMELSEGYVPNDETAEVVGRYSNDWHSRYNLNDEQLYHRAGNSWKVGSPAMLPGISIIYTQEHVNRGDIEVLKESPNTLPTGPEMPDMFFIPQAEAPVSGRSWGMRATYNCSIVKDVSEFTIIGHYKGNGCNAGRGAVDQDCVNGYFTEGAGNIWSYQEVAGRMQNTYNTVEGVATYDDNQPDPFAPGNSTQPDIFEYAMWQVRTTASYHEVEDFNNTVGSTIAGLDTPFTKASNGSWVADEAYFAARNYTHFSQVDSKVAQKFRIGRAPIDVAAPIGVRCVVRSALGSADVDPSSSSYSGFIREHPTNYTDKRVDMPGPYGRLGVQVESFLKEATVSSIFTSLSIRATKGDSNGVNLLKFATSDELQRSMTLAYGKELLQMMYDGQYSFEDSWQHDGLKGSRKAKVLTTGDVPPLAAVIPMGIWTLMSMVLAIVYGFRRRVADSLSGFSLFRLGVRYGDQLGPDVFTAKEADEVARLWQLPGTLDKM
ncbi:hypothetical protein CSOJ01_03831 [Colletotrichum sojae]|uniref:Uncharacterized protein n=1 Tax=Colletotrichum sojae TaxID=2175907 RepID=A0A8H6N0D4_9PEZI|nr:hypothetical protein CSOJ01_03831 [Colletotrichum sojae]